MTKLWRAHLLPDRDVKTESAKQQVYDFCIDYDIVGCGWPVGRHANLTLPEYKALAVLYYGRPRRDNRGYIGAINALADHMNRGDLCWIRDRERRFYIGRIAGQWEYRSSDNHYEFQIVNVRTCLWLRSDVSAPRAVRWQLGPTFLHIGDEQAVRDSIEIYNRLAAL